MLNWIAWNKTVLTFKLRTYAKLDLEKNRTVFDIETELYALELLDSTE